MHLLLFLERNAYNNRIALTLFIGNALDRPKIAQVISIDSAPAVVAPRSTIGSALTLTKLNDLTQFPLRIAPFPPRHPRTDKHILVRLLETHQHILIAVNRDSRLNITRLRIADQPRVRMRTLGPRGFSEIPLSELAALVLELRCTDEFMGREEIARNILSLYGLQKLTALVQRRLDRVLAEYF